MVYLTSRDAKTIRRTSWRHDSFDMYFHQQHFATNQFKSFDSNSGFNVCDELDLWPMFYWFPHKVGMKYWNLHAKFHTNPSRINGWVIWPRLMF